MSIVAASIYWIIVAIWLTVLATIFVYYIRNPRVFGTTRLLLAVVAVDTVRNIIENVYFGLYFGSQFGIFSPQIAGVLGNPYLLIIPKLINVAAGSIVLGILLWRWLPSAVREHEIAEQRADGLKTLTSIDEVTGLYNRRQFELFGRGEWSRFQRNLRPLSLLIVNVDQFKDVNGRFGQEAGDGILKLVAQACNSVRREVDIVARIDVSEFALLLPETDEAEARLVAERLRDLVRDSAPNGGDQHQDLTVCIGIATSSLSMSGIETLMKRSDGALYSAMRLGHDRVATASGSLHDGRIKEAA